MRTALAFVVFALLLCSGAADQETQREQVWPSEPPPDCPFPPSETLPGIAFTGRQASYTNADTWYPSWASNGNLYSPWTDGEVNGIRSDSGGPKATTGHATIFGDDPLHLKVVNAATYPGDPSPYAGRYPCGSLVHNGVWYYGTYCLHPSGTVQHEGATYNWPWLGPFVGFRHSKDFGKTWTDTAHTPGQPLFGEFALNGEPVKIGSPHFVDLGKNLIYSPDGKAYLIAHGASDPDPKPRYANASWITGDQVFLLRVKPSIETINDAPSYEFFGGYDSNYQPVWTHDFSKIKPLLEWNNNMGCVTMTYFAPLKKYLMTITDGQNTVSRYNTYILESDRITGPWSLVVYMHSFGEQAYFVNIPSKFISKDGRTAWLCYAANFTNGFMKTGFKSNPPGSRYGMCLQEFRLLGPRQR